MKSLLKIKLYDDANQQVAYAKGNTEELSKKLASWLEKFK